MNHEPSIMNLLDGMDVVKRYQRYLERESSRWNHLKNKPICLLGEEVNEVNRKFPLGKGGMWLRQRPWSSSDNWRAGVLLSNTILSLCPKGINFHGQGLPWVRPSGLPGDLHWWGFNLKRDVQRHIHPEQPQIEITNSQTKFLFLLYPILSDVKRTDTAGRILVPNAHN